MSIATVVTRGYGTFGTIAGVVMRGYLAAAAAAAAGAPGIKDLLSDRDLPYQLKETPREAQVRAKWEKEQTRLDSLAASARSRAERTQAKADTAAQQAKRPAARAAIRNALAIAHREGVRAEKALATAKRLEAQAVQLRAQETERRRLAEIAYREYLRDEKRKRNNLATAMLLAT